MKTKLVIFAAALMLLCGCGEKQQNGSNIVDKQPNETVTATDGAKTNPTLAPAETVSPENEKKAEEKLASGSANATVMDNGKEKAVDLHFQIANETGMDFVGMLVEPVTADLTKGANRFPNDYVFKTGTAINLTPPTVENGEAYVLDTTLFNIAAIDANGTGYVFQNLDLASCKQIVLEFENGEPKATVN